MADIENLTIQITAEANAAIEALTKLTSSLQAINAELDRLDPTRMKDFASGTETLSKSISQLNESVGVVRKLAENLQQATQQMGEMGKSNNATEGVQKRLDSLADSAKNATNALKKVGHGASSGGGGLRGMLDTVKSLGGALAKSATGIGVFNKAARFGFNAITAPAKLATKAIKGIGKASDETTKTAKRLAKELTRVGKMLKLMVTRMALRAVIKEVGNGFKSLALHSEQFNQSVSGMMNGAKKLGYSFSAMVSPLINALAPAINYVISLLVKLMNVINQVFSALSGSGTWNKAKDFTNNWADDIEAANKQAKELKKTVLGFDELNQLQENNANGGGNTSNNITDMFETLPVEDKWKNVADYIKNIAKRLFDPIKKAWDKVGDFVKKSWEYAMDEIFKLGESVARDFWKVWEQEKTQKIFENILKIIGWIGQAVGNLAKRFREAWDKNDTGLHILENIRDIILIITDHLESMAKSFAEWTDSLDFSPILEGFNEWLESCEEPIDAIMGSLEDLLNDFLLPIGKWAIEEGGPALLKVFTDFNNEVKWDVIRERLDRVWKALEPFAKEVGKGLIKFIDSAADKVRDFLNSEGWDSFIDSLIKWTEEVDADDVEEGLKKICDVLLGYLALEGIGLIATEINNLIGAIKTKITTVSIITVIGTLVTTIGMLTDGIKDYKEALGKGSLWEAITGNSPEDRARKRAYANRKASNPYNGNRENGEFEFTNLFKAFDNQESIDAAKDTALVIERIGEAYDSTRLYAVNYDTENTLLMQHLRENSGTYDALSASQKKTDDTLKDLKSNTEGLKTPLNNANTALNNVGKTTPILTEKQKKLDETLKGVGEKVKANSDNHKVLSGIMDDLGEQTGAVATQTDKAKTSFGNLKGVADQNIQVAPVLTKAQKDIEDSLKGVTDQTDTLGITTTEVFESFEAETANANVVFAGTAGEIQKNMDETAEDIEKQNDKIAKAFSKENWTFDGVIDGLKGTFKDALEGVKGLWNKFADKMNEGGEVGTSKLKIKLPRFAGGGFPENGLFLANSSELVGRFSNGKTAVANNEQIIQGISAGVYNAVSSALASSNSNNNGGYIANTIVVDGEVIARTVTKAQQKQQMRFSPQMG